MASIIFTIPARYGKRRSNAKTAYVKRDEVLFRLGFASYADYLRSPLWAAIRSAKLAVDPDCELCGDPATQVHHMAYTRAVLTGRNQHKLLSACGDCHHRIEFRPDGSKRNFEAVYKQLRSKLKRLGKWQQHTRHAGSAAGPHTTTADEIPFAGEQSASRDAIAD